MGVTRLRRGIHGGLVVLLAGLLGILAGCRGDDGSARGGQEVRVAAASDLKFAFDEVASGRVGAWRLASVLVSHDRQ